MKMTEMRLNNLLAACSFIALLAISMHATAATFDFANIADSQPSSATLDSYTGSVGPGPFTGELGALTMNFSSGGIGLTATAFDGATGAAYNPYLDSDWTHSGGGGQGGLGVCQVLTASNQCTPSSDDNVTFGETLVLNFDQIVIIDTTTLRNGDHNTDFTGDFTLSIDDGAAVTYALTNIFTMDLTGTKFEFFNPNSGGGSTVSNDKQFYINTLDVNPIPVPAAVWLFGSGLLGLVAVARKRA